MSDYWIQTFTGKKFDLLEPDKSMICIEDIAHHLSIENRFAGATRFPLSVAYHSLNVSSFCAEEFKLEGLLHDARETYYKDLPSPLIRMLKAYDLDYHSIMEGVDNAIMDKFLVDFITAHSYIKEIDLRMALTERNALCAPCPEKWHPSIEEKEPFNIEFMKLQPKNVEELFLKEYEKYRRI